MLVLVIISIIVCALLGLIVLIQNPKGGGLTSNFSSSSQLMGVQKTGDFLEKGTWVLAITLIVLSLIINVAGKKSGATSGDPAMQEQLDKASKPVNTPTQQMPDLQPTSTTPATTTPATPAPKSK